MSAHQPGMKTLSLAQYEALCREACSVRASQIPEEVLWFTICKGVYHHIHGYRRNLGLPYTEGPRIELYQTELERMVREAQSEEFDALEIAHRHIGGR